jgi:hypothetical protein
LFWDKFLKTSFSSSNLNFKQKCKIWKIFGKRKIEISLLGFALTSRPTAKAGPARVRVVPSRSPARARARAWRRGAAAAFGRRVSVRRRAERHAPCGPRNVRARLLPLRAPVRLAAPSILARAAATAARRLHALAAAAAHFRPAFHRRPSISVRFVSQTAPPRPSLPRTRLLASSPPRGKPPHRAPRRGAISAAACSPRRSGTFSPPCHLLSTPGCPPPSPCSRAPSRRCPHGRDRSLAAGGLRRRCDVAAARSPCVRLAPRRSP